MHRLLVLAACVVAVAALPAEPEGGRIVGGTLTSVSVYPYAAALLHSGDGVSYWQGCGGAIVTNHAILTAAHCVHNANTWSWRVRVGSSFANSGGVVHALSRIIVHPNYNTLTLDHDIAVLRTNTFIHFVNNAVQQAPIASNSYVLFDNQPLWAIGWGLTSYQGVRSEQLRHVNVWHLNHANCRQRYASIGATITDNMMCSGWWDVGGRGQCNGDSGSPVFDNNHVIVGVCSWGIECATARFGSINVAVPRHTAWIIEVAS